MNKYILGLLCSLPLTLLAQQKYQITGSFTQMGDGTKVYLTYGEMGSVVRDSATVKKGRFEFAGSIPEPIMATLSVKPGKNMAAEERRTDSKQLYLDGANIKIEGKEAVHTATVLNSPTTTSFIAYSDAVKGLSAEERQAYLQQYVQRNPKSVLIVSLIDELLFPIPVDYHVLIGLYNTLDDERKTSGKGRKLKAEIDKLKDIAIGAPAPELLQWDTNGKEVKLTALQGQYVLVDFWASWCKPCRAENPNLVKAYNRFKGNNFTILGVSIDKSKAAWLKAVEEDKLDWLQVAGEDGKENSAADVYHIMAIPQNYLLDPSGKIIAKNLKGEGLQQYLERLFNESK